MQYTLLLSIIPFFAYGNYTETPDDDCLKKEEKLYIRAMNNDVSDKAKEWEELASCNVKEVKIHLKRIKFLYDQKQFNKALDHCEALIEEDPVRKIKAAVYYYAGSSAFYMNIFNKAVSYLKKASESGYDSDEVNFKLGRCYYQLEKYEVSKDHYRQVLRLNNNNSAAWNNLALNYEEQGDYDKALGMYRKADSLANGRKGLYKANVVNNLIEQDMWKKAHKYGSKAYSLFPDNDELADNYAYTLNHFGYQDSAIAIARRILKSDPDSHKGYFRLGYSFNKKGMQDSALYYYYQDLEKEGAYPNTLHNMAEIFWENGFMDKAMRFINRSLEINYDDGFSHKIKWKILLWQHRYHALYKYTKNFVKAFPEDESAANYMGYALMQLDSFQKAIPYNKEDLRNFEGKAIAYNNLGRCYAKIGKHQKAFAYFDSAIRKNSDNSFIYHNRASLYAKIGENKKACWDLRKALEKEYTWTIDSALIKHRNEHCPEISIDRKIHYHAYKGNKVHLNEKKFIDVIQEDSAVLSNSQEEIRKDSLIESEKATGESVNNSVKIYPNPTTGRFNIILMGNQKEIFFKIYNMNSKLVKQKSIKHGQKISVNLTGKVPGTYIVLITNREEVLHTKKVVLQE